MQMGNRVRKRFDTREEALAFERGDSRKGSVRAVFSDGCAFYWKGTANERNAVRHTEWLIQHFGPDRMVSTITTADVQAMVTHLLSVEKNSHATINRKLAALSKLLKHGLDHGHLDRMPKLTYRKESKGRVRFLTPEEEVAIMDNLPDHYRAFTQFLLYTGCRVSEALRLQWQDVQGGKATFWETKNGKSRSVPLVSRAQAALQYTRGQGWIRPFARINYDTFHMAWQRAKTKAGLGHDPQVVPHVLRHTCASRLVQNKVDIYRVKEWLGHSNINVTLRYAHLDEDALKEAAAVLEAM